MRLALSPPAHPGRLRQWWLDQSVRAKGTIVIAAPLIALTASPWRALAAQFNEQQERRVALASSALSSSADQVLADAVNAETGVRGYAAADDPLFLDPYNLTLRRLAKDLAAHRAAAVADGYGHPETVVAATTAREMAELKWMRSAMPSWSPSVPRSTGWKRPSTGSPSPAWSLA